LLDRRVRIPEQMSVVGFGDLLSSACFRVPLTTVHQPKYRLGVAAMNVLIQLTRGQHAEVPRMPMELIVRSSTAGPPGIVSTVPAPVSAEQPKLSL
jgi:LacI family transcriptional regulator, galactose operon repressor